MLNRTDVIIDEFYQFLRQVDKNAKQTFIVCQLYLKQWLAESYQYILRDDIDIQTLRYGSLMFELLEITWLLNSSTPKEMAMITDRVTVHIIDKTYYGIYKGLNLGEVLIPQNSALFTQYLQLVDCNMILMFKDICSARFHSLINVQYRRANDYHPSTIQWLNELYAAGDYLPLTYGNDAYDILKLVEPCSTNK